MRRPLSAKSGFTLIEILVVVGILGAIVVIGSITFFSVLRGARKSKMISLVKQNGDYALEVMIKMIRNAREITSPCDGSDTSITILNPDRGETTFSCEDDAISSNAAELTSSQVKVGAGSCSFDCQPGEALQPDTVTISFTLEAEKEGGVPARPEEEASIDFETTVSLRNID